MQARGTARAAARRAAQRLSDYGKQLREKQKMRRMYGVLERQFRNYYAEGVARAKGVDRRAPAAAAGIAARQHGLSHGLRAPRAPRRARSCATAAILVNGKRVNIPSYQLQAGDMVEVATKAKEQLRIKAALSSREQVGFPEWVEVDDKGIKGTFKAMPERDEILPRHQRKPGRRAVLEVTR